MIFLKLSKGTVRWHNLKLSKSFSRLDLRKFSVNQKVVNCLNRSPLHIVGCKSVNYFKVGLDKTLRNWGRGSYSLNWCLPQLTSPQFKAMYESCDAHNN